MLLSTALNENTHEWDRLVSKNATSTAFPRHAARSESATGSVGTPSDRSHLAFSCHL